MKVTKKEIRSRTREIRETMRMIDEAVLKGDWDLVVELANEASCQAGQIMEIVEAE